MIISCRAGLFEATVTGKLLIVSRYTLIEADTTKDEFRTIYTSSQLFVCPLKHVPGFVVHNDGLYTQNAPNALMLLYRGQDAAQLLTFITSLLTTRESKRNRRRMRIICGGVAIITGILAWLMLKNPINISNLFIPTDIRPHTTLEVPRYAHPLQSVELTAPDVPYARRSQKDSDRSVSPAQTPADGWSLPQNVRAALPGKLKNAAARGLFTVPLSTGHARTIYVFSDPACPNCQRMERHFETVADTVNVVIFPVTIEGREESLKKLTPVMALPEARRASAWKQLFAADAGMAMPGAAQDASVVANEIIEETARGAIGVNEVAFRAYHLPGTPWAISDDGRYVPQSVLSSPAVLEAFLNGGDHDGQ